MDQELEWIVVKANELVIQAWAVEENTFPLHSVEFWVQGYEGYLRSDNGGLGTRKIVFPADCGGEPEDDGSLPMIVAPRVERILRTLLSVACAVESIRVLEYGLNQAKPGAKDGYKRLHHRVTYLVTFKHEVFAEIFESSGTLIIRSM